MSIKLRGGQWYIDATVRGVRVRDSLNTTDKATAKVRAKALEEALWMGQTIKKAEIEANTSVTLGEAFDDLYARHWCETKDKSGVRSRFATLSRFIPESTPVDTITQTTLDSLIKAMKGATYSRGGTATYPYTTATINRVEALLRTLLRDLSDRGMVAKVPRFKLFAETARHEYLSPQDEATMWDALTVSKNPNHQRCLRLFQFLTDTGCRLGEARKLTWRHIDLERRVVVLKDTKSGADVGKQLTARVHAVLLAELNDGFTTPFNGIGETMYRNAWKHALKIAEIDPERKLVRHALRHTTATRLVAAGVHLRKVQGFLGHQSYKTTLGYEHNSVVEQGDVIEALEGVTGVCRDSAAERAPNA